MSQTDTPVLSIDFASTLAAASPVLQFSGHTSVTAETVVNFPVKGLTLSCWIKTASMGSEILVSYHANAPDNSERLVIRNAASLEVDFGTNGTGGTGVSVNDGAWHHIAVSIFPTGLLYYGVVIYRNGISAYTGVGAIVHPMNKGLQTAGNLVLGTGIDTEPGFNGYMSEFRIWSRVLTDDEVMTTMQVREASGTTDLLIVWALESAASSGTVVNGLFVPSDLRFRSFTLIASWTAVNGATYNLDVSKTGGGWHFVQEGIGTNSLAITGYSLNTSYQAIVQAVAGGTPGAWSTPVTVITMSLQQPVIGLSQPTPTTLQAGWSAIDQVQQYLITQQPANGNAQNSTQTGISLDITALATGPTAYSFGVNAWSVNAKGPVNDAAVLTVPALTLAYYNTGGQQYMQANWTSAGTSPVYYYLELYKDSQGGTAVFSHFYQDVTSAQVTGINFQSGSTYYGRIRTIGIGVIGAYSAWAQAQAFTVEAPVPGTVTSDPSALTITVNWSFNTSPYQNVSYVVQLLNNNKDQPALLTATTSDKTYTFSNPQGQNIIHTGAYYYVQVLAVADHVDSPYCQAQGIGVAAVDPATDITMSANNEGLITVNWKSAGDGVAYNVTITINNVDKPAHNNVAGTSTGFTSTETGVQIGNTYAVKVTIVSTKGGQQSVPAVLQQQLEIKGTTPVVPNPPTQGDPVNLATGGYRYSHADIGFACAQPLEFMTYYDTQRPTPAENGLYSNMPLGNRWNHTYNTRLAVYENGTRVAVLWGSGRTDSYQVPSSVTGNYPAVLAPRGSVLLLNSDNVFVLTTRDQEVYKFTRAGVLTSITSSIGNVVTLSYTGSNLTSINLDATHYLHLTYYGNGMLETVADPQGRQIRYVYDQSNLQSVTGLMGIARTFTYDPNSLVLTIKDENGHTFIKNEYDGQRRVTKQWDARAIASGQDYYSQFVYSQVTENGLDKLVCNFTDRAGNTSYYKCFKDTTNLEYSIENLASGNIRRIDQVHDGFGNLLSETVYEGAALSWAAGKGNTTVYTYDGTDNLLTQTNALGQKAITTYNGNNFPLTKTDVSGNVSVFHYQGNLLWKVTDPLGRDLSFTFVAGSIKGLIESLTDVNGNTTAFTYENGYLKQATDPLGNKTIYSNDAVGRVLTEEIHDPAGLLLRTTTFGYFANNVMKKKAVQYPGQIMADAFTWQYTTDNIGNVTSQTDPEGNTITTEYNPNDFPYKVTYPLFEGQQRQTIYTYDRIDHLQEAGYAVGVVELFQFDRFGRMIDYKDGNLHEYTYQYLTAFAMDNTYTMEVRTNYPLLVEEPLTQYYEALTYDPTGRIINDRNRAGVSSGLSYLAKAAADGHSFNLQATLSLPPAQPGDPRFSVTETYDAVERLISVVNQSVKETTTTYALQADPVTHSNTVVTTTTDPLGNQEITQTDANGRLIGYKRGKGSLWLELLHVYDALGRLTSTGEKKSTGNVTTQVSYAYDTVTKLVKVSTGRPGDSQHCSVQAYNGSGQLVSQTEASGGPGSSMTYAPWGAMHTYTNVQGQQTYGFDAAGRFNQISFPDGQGTILHTLDGVGNRLNTKVGGVANVTRTFDFWNRMKSRVDVGQRSVQYGYDAVDQLTKMTYPDTTNVEYVYDDLYRMRSVTDWGNRKTSYQYKPTGVLTRADYANGSQENRTYDDSDRLTGLEHHSGDLIVASVGFTLDALGNPISNETILPLPPQLNVADHALVYNVANQLTSYDGVTLDYDGDGNQKTMVRGGGTQAITYDMFDRVKTAGQDNYSYDPDGLRTGTTLGGIAKTYVFDSGGYVSPALNRAEPSIDPHSSGLDRLLEVLDAQGVKQAKYVYGMGLIGGEDADGNFLVYHEDHLGNILSLTNGQGNIQGKLLYDVYGQVNNQSGVTASPFLFGGSFGVMDDGNGLSYMRARSYAPMQGRFMQRDLLFGDPSMPQTLNRYAYVNGDPVMYFDPLGLSRGKDIGIGIGIGLAIGVGIGAIIGGIAGYLVGGTAGAAVGGAILGGMGGLLGGALGGGIGGAIGGIGGGAIGGGTGGFLGSAANIWRTMGQGLRIWWQNLRIWWRARDAYTAVELELKTF